MKIKYKLLNIPKSMTKFEAKTSKLEFIKKYERFGVPVNIIYSRNMKDGLVLPEILSSSIVIDNFERIK